MIVMAAREPDVSSIDRAALPVPSRRDCRRSTERLASSTARGPRYGRRFPFPPVAGTAGRCQQNRGCVPMRPSSFWPYPPELWRRSRSGWGVNGLEAKSRTRRKLGRKGSIEKSGKTPEVFLDDAMWAARIYFFPSPLMVVDRLVAASVLVPVSDNSWRRKPQCPRGRSGGNAISIRSRSLNLDRPVEQHRSSLGGLISRSRQCAASLPVSGFHQAVDPELLSIHLPLPFRPVSILRVLILEFFPEHRELDHWSRAMEWEFSPALRNEHPNACSLPAQSRPHPAWRKYLFEFAPSRPGRRVPARLFGAPFCWPLCSAPLGILVLSTSHFSLGAGLGVPAFIALTGGTRLATARSRLHSVRGG